MLTGHDVFPGKSRIGEPASKVWNVLAIPARVITWGGPAGNVPSGEHDFPCIGNLDPGDEVEDRRLAHTVRADQTSYFGPQASKNQHHLPQGSPPKGFANADYLQEGCSNAFLLLRSRPISSCQRLLGQSPWGRKTIITTMAPSEEKHPVLHEVPEQLRQNHHDGAAQR